MFCEIFRKEPSPTSISFIVACYEKRNPPPLRSISKPAPPLIWEAIIWDQIINIWSSPWLCLGQGKVNFPVWNLVVDWLFKGFRGYIAVVLITQEPPGTPWGVLWGIERLKNGPWRNSVLYRGPVSIYHSVKPPLSMIWKPNPKLEFKY